MPKQEERINPIRMHIPEGIEGKAAGLSGKDFVLDFSRDSAMAAQLNGLVISEIDAKSIVMIQKLFFFSFRMNHRTVSKSQTDALLEEIGGLPEDALMQLAFLYQQASTVGIIREKGAESKNPGVTMDWD